MDLKGKGLGLASKGFAVVGASNNPEKYGFRVVEALKKISGNVYPINPKETQILGLKVFKKVSEVRGLLDVVVFVVPPKVSLEVLGELRLKKYFFWFQPGSFDESVVDFCKENKLRFSVDKCIIVESEKQLNSQD